MKVFAIVPAYRVRRQVCAVVAELLAQGRVQGVVVVDDACPEASGVLVRETYASEPRVRVVFHATNQGVGGAVLTGYTAAFDAGADIAVKVDGDGQMPVALLPRLVAPIRRAEADYTKGNRFFRPRELAKMPRVRLFGNALLSVISKLSSGYWSVMDPTNGFTALHRVAWACLEPARLARDYFFESDMLHQLGIARAVVIDVPTPVIYADESSSLRISRVLLKFPLRFVHRFLRRTVYLYFIREFSIATLETVFGLPLLLAGLAFGGYNWAGNAMAGRLTPPGTVMITGLLILIGFQLLMSAVNYDITHEPSMPLAKLASENVADDVEPQGPA